MPENTEAVPESVPTPVKSTTTVKASTPTPKVQNKYTVRAHEIQLAKRAKHHRKLARRTKGQAGDVSCTAPARTHCPGHTHC